VDSEPKSKHKSRDASRRLGAAAKMAPHAKKEAATATSELRTSALFRQRPEAARPGRASPGYAEIKTILRRTLVFHFAFKLLKGLLCRV
jgi:hypothetical protein